MTETSFDDGLSNRGELCLTTNLFDAIVLEGFGSSVWPSTVTAFFGGDIEAGHRTVVRTVCMYENSDAVTK